MTGISNRCPIVVSLTVQIAPTPGFTVTAAALIRPASQDLLCGVGSAILAICASPLQTSVACMRLCGARLLALLRRVPLPMLLSQQIPSTLAVQAPPRIRPLGSEAPLQLPLRPLFLVPAVQLLHCPMGVPALVTSPLEPQLVPPQRVPPANGSACWIPRPDAGITGMLLLGLFPGPSRLPIPAVPRGPS